MCLECLVTYLEEDKMKTAEQILISELAGFALNPFPTNQIVKAMEKYAEQQTDLTCELFSKPMCELQPLEKIWQKETNSPYVIPDMTDFCKWIVEKITETPVAINAPNLFVSLVECRENLLRYIPNCAGDGSHNGSVLKRVEQSINNVKCEKCNTRPLRWTDDGVRYLKCDCGKLKIAL